MRVMIHSDEDGMIFVYADTDVEVYWVDERTPEDRIYRMDPGLIPEGALTGDVGHKNDGSAASIKAVRLGRAMDGLPGLEVIKNDD